MSLRKILATFLAAAIIMAVGSQVTAASEIQRRTLLPGTKNATTLVEIDSGNPGPTVWISGGVHGSELAGWQAAEQIAKWDIAKGRLIVIPHANQPAVAQQVRFPKGGTDLNRQFPQRAGQKANGALAGALWRELQRYKPDWVFDLHEAMSNRNSDKNSVGQTIIVHPKGGMSALAGRIIKQLNGSLTNKQSFQVIRNPVQGSLAWAAGEVLGTNAAIVETSRIYALASRVQWHLRLMRYALADLGMGPVTSGG